MLPSAIDPKYASETPGRARMFTCVDQYNANRATKRSPRIISHDEVANPLSPIADIVVTIVQVTLESWSCQSGLRHVGLGG